MTLHVFNSLTKKKEPFHPLSSDHVSMYHCGPTVYDRIHIGNLRTFFLADTLRRYFEFTGKTVLQVMNITDIGHISGDADFGEDKMMKLLKRKNLPITLENMLFAAAEETVQFEKDLALLNILHPHVLPKASDHIPEQVTMIQKLLEKGHAYQTSSAIYFDTASDPHYGLLGGLTTEGQDENSRINEEEKKNPQDFALWKFDDLGFTTELGKGFPGWHIECSAMSIKYLGEEFDIHTGGMDLKPIHHNNEIAQSCCATGKNFAHYWMHGEFLNIDNEKMAKSFGNMFTLADLEEKNISPLALRLLFLQAHYRSLLNFSWDALEASTNLLRDLYRVVSKFAFVSNVNTNTTPENSTILEYYNDDLNTAGALSELMKYLQETVDLSQKAELLLSYDNLFGLGFNDVFTETKKLADSSEIQDLISQRKVARDNKDYSESDRLRDELSKLNMSVNDAKDESQYFIKSILGITLE